MRTWVDENDPDNAWPRTIVYRNLRHHAATRWFHDELGESWEVVAQYLGDKLTAVLDHYVRAGEGALRDSVGKLAKFQKMSSSQPPVVTRTNNPPMSPRVRWAFDPLTICADRGR